MDSKAIAGIIVVAIVAIAGISIFALSGDNDKGGNGNDGSSEKYVTDALGRNVAIPANLDNGIVTIGSCGPLRFASMFDVFDDLIEVDKGDITDNRNGRGYSYAYGYNTLDVNTQSHPDNALESATAESIASKNPSLVITYEQIWNNYSENFQLLSKRCTIVVLKNQQMKFMTDDKGGLAEYFEFNVNLLGKVLSKEDRAKEVISGIEGLLDDIRSLSGTSDKKVYVAGMTISGSNSLNTTFPTYLPFTINGINNAYDGGSTENKVVMTVEAFTKTAMDMIVVDPSSSDKIKDNPDSQYVLEYLYGINNDSDASNDIPIYVTVPIVWDSINYDASLASAYYTAYLVYGNLTLEETKKKINNVFEVFYGEHGSNVFEDMKEFFVGKSSSYGQEMPVLGEVVVKKNDSGYYLAAA